MAKKKESTIEDAIAAAKESQVEDTKDAVMPQVEASAKVLDKNQAGTLTFHKGEYKLYNERGQLLQVGTDQKEMTKLFSRYCSAWRQSNSKIKLVQVN